MASSARVTEGMSMHALNDTLAKVRAECMSSQGEYGDFASMHEAYGVLAEEVAELFEAVRMKQKDIGSRRSQEIRAEALQVAAVAVRIAEQCARVTR